MNKIKITLFIVLIIFLVFWFVSFSKKEMEDLYYAQLVNTSERRIIAVPKESTKPKLKIDAEAAISVKINTSGKEKVLFEKETDKGLPIASLTKLMTAIIVLENYNQVNTEYNFNTLVSISEKAANQVNAYWAGNLKTNEKKSIQELLELALIYSSNDSSFALSELIGEKNFIEKMNQKTEELNLKNTSFFNSTGLDLVNGDIPNYSTANDLVKIVKYILKNHPIIFEISLKNKDYKLDNALSSLYFGENQELVGGKTGYTKKAGGCLLTVFKNKKGQVFINIVLGAKSYQERIEETQKIINWINL